MITFRHNLAVTAQSEVMCEAALSRQTALQNVYVGRCVPEWEGVGWRAILETWSLASSTGLICTWPTVTLSKIVLLSEPYSLHLRNGWAIVDV